MLKRYTYELLGSFLYSMQTLHQHGILITEQQVSDSNPLYELINATKFLPRNLLPVSRNEAHNAHQQQGTLGNTTLHNTVRINAHQSNKPSYLCTKLF